MYEEVKNNVLKFAKSVGIEFNNVDLLVKAFTHRSFVNEHREFTEHNERLEFLGDAVLELISSDFLYKKYQNKAEGELTAIRAALVNTQSISTAAKQLGMNDYLLLSKGESKDTGRARDYILANTFEAVLGAIYLDQGFGVAYEYVKEHLLGKTEDIVKNRLWQDAKSRLQEIAQDQISITPNYKLISEQGPDHNKVFTVAVLFDNEEIVEGTGKSKREAEQNAAAKALELRGW